MALLFTACGVDMTDKDALNENLEYCNQLAERINILSSQLLELSNYVKDLGSEVVKLKERANE